MSRKTKCLLWLFGAAIAAEAVPAAADPAIAHDQWRLELKYPGVYRVTGKELSDAGIPLADVVPEKVGLYSAGSIVPVFLSGVSDGTFDTTDTLEFVGESPRGDVTWYMPTNKYNVYYLKLYDSNPVQYRAQAVAAVEENVKQHFWQWQHLEKDYLFWFSTLPPDQTDNFFWFSHRAGTPPGDTFQTWLSFPGFEQSLNLPAEVTMQVFGATKAVNLSPSHQFELLYNEQNIGTLEFDGIGLDRQVFTIDSAKVADEPTRIGLKTPDNRTTAVDSIFMDWMNLRYPSRFDGNGIEFYRFNNDLVSDSGSTEVLHITDLPASASVFDPGNRVVWQLAENQTSAEIKNCPNLTTYTAVTPAARMRVEAIKPTIPLADPQQLPADLQALVVYHPSLRTTAHAYTAYRRERGWKIEAVSVESVFDKLNNGFVSDETLKKYIASVNDHATSLSHIVLIGDAYFDHREAESHDAEKQYETLIPIHWVYRPGVTWSGGYQDDNWYGSFENEFRPDIAVGRIAVNSDAEGMEYLRKVIEYEVLKKGKDDQGLLISSVEKSFQQYVTEIGTTYKDKLSSFTYLFPEAEKATQEVADLLNAFNKGAQLVYYVGHGGAMVWRVGPVDFARQKDLFTPKEVRRLTNQGHYPVVVCASCYTTSFDQPESIGEALVNQPSGGAIAVIGAPWKATVQESHDFNRHFFKYYFSPAVKTIGEASLKAHRDHIPENQSHALFNSFTMLGDPCLEIVR